MRCCKSALTLLLLVLFGAISVWGQTTSTVTGTVTDPSGAVVPNAKVELRDVNTNAVLNANTSASGLYIFPNVPPGTYEVTVTASGFQKSVVPNLVAQVGKPSTANVKMSVGAVNQTVEVTTTTQELQTMNAAVGNVISGNALQSLPSLSRDTTALLQLQPLASPSYNMSPSSGSGDITSGQVAGARSDQNTFMLDGGDATSNTEGDNNYVSGVGTPQGVVPTPVESIEEFRVSTNNADTFSRSAGAQVQMVTRRGGNTFHGALWEYNQNTLYNANFWQVNHVHQPRNVWQDNRFGGRLGGRLIKDKAYFFLMYEGHKFKKTQPFERTVPSDSMRAGILQFKDSSGNVVKYNFAPGAPTAACIAGACDPRGKGMSPTIQQLWSKYLPHGNNPAEGDGLNTIGFDSSVPIIDNENDGIARFDYNLSSNWSIMASGRYSVTDSVTAAQVDIGGLLPGDKLGVPSAVRGFPLQPRYYVVGLTGRLTPNLTNDFHVDLLRHNWAWAPHSPFPQLPGLGAALQVGAESSNAFVPMNVDTQNARTRVWDGFDYNFNDEVSWLKGNHLIQVGGSARKQHFLHVRDDKVTGGLAEPIYYTYYSSSHNAISSAGYVPAGVRSADYSRWNNDLATILGIVNTATQMLTRKGDLTPQTPGTPMTQHTNVDWYDLHAADTWHIRPSLTFTYGLDWGVQLPPYETNGLQTIMEYASNGHPVGATDYLTNLAAAANNGTIYNPLLKFVPIRQAGQKYPNAVDWHDFAPRFSFAYSPAADESTWWGKLVGNQKSSIRAGYGRYYDRLNGVGLVMTPALGIGFADLSACNAPNTTGACAGGHSTPASAFRIGVDGNKLNIPALTPITGAIIPGANVGTTGANSVYENHDWRIDPNRKVAAEDTWTFSIQRQTTPTTLLEVGYVGRVAHHLYSTSDINQVPGMFKLNGQTWADAYDTMMKRTNFGNTAAYTGPEIPFFTKFGGAAAVYKAESSNFNIGDVNTIWDDLWSGLNINSMPLDSQMLTEEMSTSQGQSGYNAFYTSFRKTTGHGLLFQVNYTWSHSIDNIGYGQQWVGINWTDAFNPKRDMSSSYFDRRHVINGFFVYDMPFGKGRHFFNSGSWADRIIGGWQVTGSITASTGVPQGVYGASCDELGGGYYANCATMVPLSGKHFSESAHYLSGGTVQAFTNNDQMLSNFRLPLYSDTILGGGDVVRGMNRWNVDASINKNTKITERVAMGLSLQAINVFNHMEFNDYGPDLFDQGVSTAPNLSSQFNNPRYLSIGLRFDF